MLCAGTIVNNEKLFYAIIFTKQERCETATLSIELWTNSRTATKGSQASQQPPMKQLTRHIV